MKILTLFLLLFTFSFSGIAGEFPEPMKPARLVNDFTNLFTPQQNNALERKLKSFNDTSSTQIAIATVPSIYGYDPNDYAQRLAEKWGIGQRGKDNGILLLVKPKSQHEKGQVAIAVGYGLEGVIPDAIASRIIRNEIIPQFQQGNYYTGIVKATNVLMKLSAGEFTAEQYAGKKKPDSGIWLFIPFLIVFLIPFFIRKRKGYTTGSHGNDGFPPIFFGGFGSSRGSSFGSFHSGGGSFGGFGGGGFGGGGASGSW